MEREPRSIRSALGIPLRVVAEHTGISVPTLTLFEAAPEDGVRGPTKRARIGRWYAIVLETLLKLELMQKEAARDNDAARARRRRRRRARA